MAHVPLFIGLLIWYVCLYWAKSELSVCFEWAEERNHLIQIIADSETIPQVDPEFSISSTRVNSLLAQEICRRSSHEKRSRKYLSCNTLEQFLTLNRFSWIFWKINFNFRLQLCWKWSLNWSVFFYLWNSNLGNYLWDYSQTYIYTIKESSTHYHIF